MKWAPSSAIRPPSARRIYLTKLSERAELDFSMLSAGQNSCGERKTSLCAGILRPKITEDIALSCRKPQMVLIRRKSSKSRRGNVPRIIYGEKRRRQEVFCRRMIHMRHASQPSPSSRSIAPRSPGELPSNPKLFWIRTPR